jgi:hypothetical protein
MASEDKPRFNTFDIQGRALLVERLYHKDVAVFPFFLELL